MKLGGPVFGQITDALSWVNAHRELGYSAAYCPLDERASGATVHEYRDAALDADLVIAEVGAWSNPISRNDRERSDAISLCQQRLALADEIGARCCVNISGSRGSTWDGPDASHYTTDVFELIVDTVREIIDAVTPRRSFYVLETMPWIAPDSVDSYIKLIMAIDRKAFGVHLDPVNLINSPERYYRNSGLLNECFAKLGPWIKSCHAKDIILRSHLTVHLEETAPGEGFLDYRTYIRSLSKLDSEIPVMLEHLPDAQAYLSGAKFIRLIASEVGVEIQ
jgi:sugar phosphate isomerase/epimerase